MDRNENNSESSIIDHYIDYEDMKIGHAYIMQLKTGAILSGGLVSKYEFWDRDSAEIIRAYTFMVTSSKTIDFTEGEIETIDLLEHYNEQRHKSVLEYLEEFQEEHNIKCFNDEGRLSNSTILGNVLTGDRIWNKLSEEEKKKFVEKLRMTSNEIVEIIDILCNTLQENSKLHSEKLKVLEQMTDISNRINRIERVFPNMDSAEKLCNFFYKDLGISDLINLTV